MAKDSDSFNFGVLAALAVVALHDQEVIYREIVDTVDEVALIKCARRNGDMRWSGLSKYKYGRNPQRQSRHTR